MSTVEMEVFSNSQLLIITLLMFIGGEVFTSMAGLFLRQSKPKLEALLLHRNGEKVASVLSSNHSSSPDQNAIDIDKIEQGVTVVKVDHDHHHHIDDDHDGQDLMSLYHSSIRVLGFVVLGYLLVVNGLGIALVYVYLSLVSSKAREVLNTKGLKPSTFSLFTTVSTFASCGFVPTNENMMAFAKNSGLLLILIPQVLLGNTLFPSCLRFSIWIMAKCFKKSAAELRYLLKNSKEIGYLHLLPRRHSRWLVGTVLGFVGVQVLMFSSMEWKSEGLKGLNPWQKVVGIVFQSVNTRHTGETIMDLSTISPAILVLIVVLMYLPPYTSFIWIKSEDWQQHPKERKSRGKIVENLIFSQLSYLAIFVILICITERQNMKQDPLNFNVFNIVVEVISAYGNVGFTMGYSCERQIKPIGNCEGKWYGFVGKWSDQGKIILIAVMFFGRLKKFNMRGGKAWKLL